MSSQTPLATAMKALARAVQVAGDEHPVTEHVIAALVAVGQVRSQMLDMAGACPCPLAKREIDRTK